MQLIKLTYMNSKQYEITFVISALLITLVGLFIMAIYIQNEINKPSEHTRMIQQMTYSRSK